MSRRSSPRGSRLAPWACAFHILSALLADCVEQGLASANPCRTLPRGTRALCRTDHNPEDTPFLDERDDIRRVFLALSEPVNVAYALGAMAGLRTGEVIALRWENVDLAAIGLDLTPGNAKPGAFGPRMTHAPGSTASNLA